MKFWFKDRISYIKMYNGELYQGYVKPEDARRALKVSHDILRKWDKEGKIQSIRTNGNHRRYLISNLLQQKPKKQYIYARVSSSGQKKDLEEQVKYLRERYPDYELIKDIGSGLNFKREGLKTILDTAIKGELGEVVVTYKDRLSRFGFDLIEWIVSKYSNGKIVVLNDCNQSPEEELTRDLISIISVFSSRIYGLRKYKKSIYNQIKTKDPEITIIPNKTGE